MLCNSCKYSLWRVVTIHNFSLFTCMMLKVWKLHYFWWSVHEYSIQLQNDVIQGKHYNLDDNFLFMYAVMSIPLTTRMKPGACFSKVPKLFGRISGDIILFISSKRWRLEARNLAVIFIFIPFATYYKTSFTE